MNCFKAKAEKRLEGWVVMFRLPHWGASKPVRNHNGKIRIFKTQVQALQEANAIYDRWLNGDDQSWNDFDATRAKKIEAEKLFKKVVTNE